MTASNEGTGQRSMISPLLSNVYLYSAFDLALLLFPDKTRLIEFGRFAAANRKRRGLRKPKPSILL